MSIYQKIQNLFAQKQIIEKEIMDIQKSCKHTNEIITSIRENEANSNSVIRCICKNCNNQTSFSEVRVPYACKLLMQELEAMSIMPRIIT